MKKKEKYCKLKNCNKEDRSWITEKTGSFTVIPGTIGKIISMSAFSGQCRVLWFGYPLSYNGSPFEGWQVSKKNIEIYQQHMTKKWICKILGHKPKEYPPLQYWVERIGAVNSPNKPIFCSRCGCGVIEMIYKL